jgi:hypothetical protein
MATLFIAPRRKELSNEQRSVMQPTADTRRLLLLWTAVIGGLLAAHYLSRSLAIGIYAAGLGLDFLEQRSRALSPILEEFRSGLVTKSALRSLGYLLILSHWLL